MRYTTRCFKNIFADNKSNHFMRYKLFIGFSLSVTMFILSCNTKTNVDASLNEADSASKTNGGFATQIEWGKHLVIISGCGDCHTPKKMTDKGPVNDETLLLSGAQLNMPVPDIKTPGVAATYDETTWIGPWGKSFAANITPDSTGIGLWKESQFINCLRKGLFKGLDGARPLMPPMPWQDYSQMSDNEMKAIFAYLKSVKPVHNVVREYVPPVAVAK